MSGGRIEGIDVARGVAGLVMIQGHAYHGWVAPEEHATVAYQVTRVLGTLPLPAFLLLAGASVMLRVDAAQRREEDPAKVRRGVVRRGLQIVLTGYLVNAVYMLMDGGRGLETLFRGDVLQVIGLSIALIAFAGVRGRVATRARLLKVALGFGLLTLLPSPWLNALAPDVTGPLRYPLALLLAIPGVATMPLFPLGCWFAAGIGLAGAMLAVRRFFLARGRDDVATVKGGAPTPIFLAFAAAGLALAVLGRLGTNVMVDVLGGTLSQAHPAVWMNAIELAGRGVLLIALSAAALPFLRARAKHVLLTLGRNSLVAYVFHIPFCYGAIGAPLRGELGFVEATFFVLLLMIVSYGAVVLWRSIRAPKPRPRPAPAT